MTKIRVVFIIFAFIIFSLLYSNLAVAQFDNVTLNGEKIDPRFFTLAQKAIRAESDYCVARNPEWVREFIVMLFLTKAEAQPLLPEGINQTHENIWNMFVQDPEQLEPLVVFGLGPTLWGLRKMYLQTLLDNLPPVSTSQIEEEYNRLVKADHPIVSDVVFVKTRQLKVSGEDNRQLAQESIEKGADLIDLYERFDPDYPTDSDGKLWFIIAAPDRTDPSYLVLTGSVGGHQNFDRNVEKGEILGPIKSSGGKYRFTQIVDKIHIDTVDLDNALPGYPDYLSKRIHWKLKRARLPQFKKQLREQAEVRVDGKLVHADESTYRCGYVRN